LAPLKEKYEWQPCPEWGTIVVKMWRFGPFLTSSLYPEVKWISSIPDDALNALQAEHGWKTCPTCWEGTLVVKKARRGNYFLACNKYPTCKHAENIPWQPDSSWGGKTKARWSKKKVTKKKK
jgi:putative DNA topoisomerase